MALTRITKGVIKPNENYDTHNINSTGIVTAIGLDVNGNGDISGNLSVGGVLTYEDVTSIDSVGIITARDGIHVGAGISVVGIVTATGADINGDLDVDGHTNLDNVSVAGVTTFSNNVHVGTGVTIETNGQATFSGITTSRGFFLPISTGSNTDNIFKAGVLKIFDNGSHLHIMGPYNKTLYDHSGTRIILTNDFRIQNTASSRTYFRGVNLGAASLYWAGSNNHGVHLATTEQGIEVTGHSELDNVNIAGVTTFAQKINLSDNFIRNCRGFNTGNEQARIVVKAGDNSAGGGLRIVEYHNDDTTLFTSEIANFYTTGIELKENVSVTGNLTIPDSIIHSGDTNTKIRFPADDTIQFDTSGHDRLYITSDGKIGLGTVTPAVDIHHFSDGLNGNGVRLENREGYVSFTNDANGLYLDAEYFYFRNRAGSTTYASINTSGNLSVFKDLDVDGHTELDNVRIVGVTTTNTLVIGDTSDTNTNTSDNRIRIGNNQDLQIFHGPNNSYIRNTTNSFNIEQYANATLDIFSNHDVRLRVNGGELAVDCSHNQGVDLYYDASVHTSPKISTRSNGAYVNGLLEILLNASQSTSTPLLLQNSAAAGTSSNPDVVKLAFGSQGVVKGSIRAAVYGEGHMTFHTNNDTEKVRITAAGRVGIMETSPDRSLHIKDSGIIKLENTSTGGWAGLEYLVSSGTNNYDAYMGLQDSDGLFFIDNNSNGIDFCIKQNGRIGMGGETNPIATLTINKGSTGQNTTHTDGELLRLEGYDSTNSRHGIGFGRYNGGQNGYKPAAFIGAATGTWSSYTNCHLVFSTRNSTGDDDPTERLRITNDGKVVAGGTGAGYDERLQAHGAGACLGLNSTSGAAELRFYESGAGRFRMKTLSGNPGILFEDWTNGATRAEISGDGDFKIHSGTRGWSTVQYRYNSRGIRRHYREFGTGASSSQFNLIRVRRHYWGWGHYRIRIMRGYYSGIIDSVYYLNGHGRNDGSYNPSYTMTELRYGGDNANFSYSNRITLSSPSNSSPGDDYATYVDVRLECPSYMYFTVEVEAYTSGYSTNTSSIPSDAYALHN